MSIGRTGLFIRGSGVAVAMAAILVGISSAAAAPLTYRTVALTGTDGVYGPGLGTGVTFNTLDGGPAMNLSGQVVFRGADISTGGLPNGVWMRPDATNTSFNNNLALEGGPRPGGGVYATSNSYNSMAINDAGETAFRTGASQGVFSSDGVTMKRVGLASDIAPGVGGATYSTSPIASGAPLFNSAGATAYVGSLTVGTGTPPVVITSGSNNSQAIFIGTGDNVNNPNANNTPVVRAADWFAGLGGTAADTKINSPTQSTMSLNGNNHYVVSTSLQGTAIVTGTGATSNSQAIISNRSGINDVVARVGNAAPDSAGNPTADVYRTLGSSAIGYNNLEHVGFVSSLRQGATQTLASGLFTDINGGVAGGTLKRFASAGGAIGNVYALGDTGNTTPLSEFSSLTYGTSATFSTVLLNHSDEMLYSANLSSGGQAYFRTDTGGSIHRVLRIGDIAFSPDPLSTGGTGTSTISGVNNITMNGLGQAAYLANITGPGVSAGLGNGSVLFATETDGTRDVVARTGTQFTDGLGNTHTISSINLDLNTGNEDGRASGFNDAGFLSFNLQFTDGTAGDFVTQVPEPATIAALAFMSVLLIGRRRR